MIAPDPENINQTEYHVSSKDFVLNDHLKVRLPNGNITNFDYDKTYIINATTNTGQKVDFEEMDTHYQNEDLTLALNKIDEDVYSFRVYDLSTRIVAGRNINITNITKNRGTNKEYIQLQINATDTTYSVDDDTLQINNENVISIKSLSSRLSSGTGIVLKSEGSSPFKTTITAPSGSKSILLTPYYDDNSAISGYDYSVNSIWISKKGLDGYSSVFNALTGILCGNVIKNSDLLTIEIFGSTINYNSDETYIHEDDENQFNFIPSSLSSLTDAINAINKDTETWLSGEFGVKLLSSIIGTKLENINVSLVTENGKNYLKLSGNPKNNSVKYYYGDTKLGTGLSTILIPDGEHVIAYDLYTRFKEGSGIALTSLDDKRTEINLDMTDASDENNTLHYNTTSGVFWGPGIVNDYTGDNVSIIKNENLNTFSIKPPSDKTKNYSLCWIVTNGVGNYVWVPLEDC